MALAQEQPTLFGLRPKTRFGRAAASFLDKQPQTQALTDRFQSRSSVQRFTRLYNGPSQPLSGPVTDTSRPGYGPSGGHADPPEMSLPVPPPYSESPGRTCTNETDEARVMAALDHWQTTYNQGIVDRHDSIAAGDSEAEKRADDEILQSYKGSAQAMEATKPEHAKELRAIGDRYWPADRDEKSRIIVDLGQKIGINLFVKFVALPVTLLLGVTAAGYLAGIPVYATEASGQVTDHTVLRDGEGGGHLMIDQDNDGVVDHVQPVVEDAPNHFLPTGAIEEVGTGNAFGIMGDAIGQGASGALNMFANFF